MKKLYLILTLFFGLVGSRLPLALTDTEERCILEPRAKVGIFPAYAKRYLRKIDK